MSGILKRIVDRILEDEDSLFRAFDPTTFPLRKREVPLDPFSLGNGDFLVIAEVFREGTRLHEDQSLTI